MLQTTDRSSDQYIDPTLRKVHAAALLTELHWGSVCKYPKLGIIQNPLNFVAKTRHRGLVYGL